ncbi:unnamed protein product, partial [Mesorhabditis belari]|uniref:Uncharacterized protein n=1 Tax=Mesorhabditis belari TaxID=2138241 RepID=A0AAF3F1A5_9BILA
MVNNTLAYRQIYTLTAALLGDFVSAEHSKASKATPFFLEETHEIGLKNKDGIPCLSLAFRAEIVNYNTDLNHSMPFDFTAADLKGNCAEDLKRNAYISATIKHNNLTKRLQFYFHTKNIYIKQYEELRWQMRKVIYSETSDGETIYFESRNASIVMSAPLNQKFVCRDKLNVTLFNPVYKDVVIVFPPEIVAQPYGLKSNLFICERTRKRSLRESFNTKTTIFSGVVLALSSIAMIVWHSVRRHMMPDRKQEYLNINE